MKLMHIITGLRTGGAERMLLKLAGVLKTRGVEQRVVSLSGLGEIGPELRTLGIPVSALEMGAPSRLPVAAWRLRKLIRGFRPDIVQTWLYHADLAGGICARLSGVGTLVWGIRHSDLSREANKSSTLRVARICGKLSAYLPDGILCNSRRAMENHTAIGYDDSRMRHIPNGFETEHFRKNAAARAEWRNRLGIPSEAVLAGWVGRNHPQKSPENFLRAALMLSRSRSDIHFAMVGSGLLADDPILGGYARENVLAGRLHLLGPCNGIPGFLSALDIFVSSSAGEGFSNALAEAMCCEIPCVATDTGDSAVIVGETGLMAPTGDPEALARQIGVLADSGAVHRLELGVAARQRVMSRWSLDAVADEYLGYYGDLMRKQGRKMTAPTSLQPEKSIRNTEDGMGKGSPLQEETIAHFKMHPETLAAIESAWRDSGIPKNRFRILDFGCGRGRAVVSLRRMGFDAHGVDVDAVPVRHGQDYLGRTGEAPAECLSVVGFSGEGLPESAYDFCFSDQVLEHVVDLEAVAGALTAALRPNGKGFHVFPAKWRPIEPHVRMPFFHWLPRIAGIRYAAGAIWLGLGFDPHWQQAKGSPLFSRAKIYADYTLRKTHYRHLRQIRQAFERHGVSVRFAGGGRWPGQGWLQRCFGSVRLELEKPGTRPENRKSEPLSHFAENAGRT